MVHLRQTKSWISQLIKKSRSSKWLRMTWPSPAVWRSRLHLASRHYAVQQVSATGLIPGSLTRKWCCLPHTAGDCTHLPARLTSFKHDRRGFVIRPRVVFAAPVAKKGRCCRSHLCTARTQNRIKSRGTCCRTNGGAYNVKTFFLSCLTAMAAVEENVKSV